MEPIRKSRIISMVSAEKRQERVILLNSTYKKTQVSIPENATAAMKRS